MRRYLVQAVACLLVLNALESGCSPPRDVKKEGQGEDYEYYGDGGGNANGDDGYRMEDRLKRMSNQKASEEGSADKHSDDTAGILDQDPYRKDSAVFLKELNDAYNNVISASGRFIALVNRTLSVYTSQGVRKSYGAESDTLSTARESDEKASEELAKEAEEAIEAVMRNDNDPKLKGRKKEPKSDVVSLFDDEGEPKAESRKWKDDDGEEANAESEDYDYENQGDFDVGDALLKAPGPKAVYSPKTRILKKNKRAHLVRMCRSPKEEDIAEKIALALAQQEAPKVDAAAAKS